MVWELNSSFFAAASEIFFGKESICTAKLRHLLLLIRCNNKNFCAQIALDELIVATFLLAVDHRFQHWLGICECATVLQSQASNRVLQFNNIIEDILNG
jgi:hypothetical protein